jgi:hypothetical protein
MTMLKPASTLRWLGINMRGKKSSLRSTFL